MPRGRTLFVWQESVPSVWPDGWDSVCVKVADGSQTGQPGGFDWASNANAWHNAATGHQVGVWLFLYPRDGAEVADVLKQYAPWADYVVLDVEDPQGGDWTGNGLAAVVGAIRQALPGTAIGYSTYPTRHQAVDQAVDFDALKTLCDFAVPQVYFPYQRAELDTVYADNKNPIVAVSPDDDAQWLTVATDAVHRTGAVFVWRAGLADTASWGVQIPQPATPVPVAPAVDVLRPETWGPVPPAVPFVAWDGKDWWMTNMVTRVALTEDQVRGAVGAGFVVRPWPECARQTGLVVSG